MVEGEKLEVELPEQLNLGAYYLDVNLEEGRAERVALYYKDETYTFRELWTLANRVGNVLRALGVAPENRVLLILEDSPAWVASWFATMKIGAVGTHAYTYLHPDDYEHLLRLVRPQVVIADAVTLERVRQAVDAAGRRQAVLYTGVDRALLRAEEHSLEALLSTAGDTLEIEPTHRDDIAFWNFSGGTTGKPKGVPHMHRDGVLAAASFDHVFGYTPDDVVLRVPKLFFHYARDLGFLFPLRKGASIVLFEERTTVRLIYDLVARHRPSVLINVPTMMRAMLQTPPGERADLGCVRCCMSSGEPLTAQLYAEWFETFGLEAVNRFGSAESAMGYLCNRPGAVVPGSSGTVTPLAAVKLVDEHGAEVADGETGRLMLHCDSAGQYYVRDHEKSKATFPGGDWVDTGDYFTMDRRGYFWYQGRGDDMVKVSGVWVSPLEIERRLQNYPGIREVATCTVDDDDGLKKIVAFVVHPEADGTRATRRLASEMKRFCKETLAPYKVPRTIRFLDELPKTGPGKIDRTRLKAWLASQAATRVA